MNRRKFIKSVLISGTVFLWRIEDKAEAVPLKTHPSGPSKHGFFTVEELTILGALVNQVMPEAVQFGVVKYIEGLLTAFDVDPPRIYAGRSSSADFILLTRSQEYAWRLRLYGSKGVPGGDPNEAILGTKIGLRELFKKNLQKAQNPPADYGYRFPAEASPNLNSLDAHFLETLRILVVEGSFSAPEYGGNSDLQGWKMIQFEGDTQPFGYASFNSQTGTYQENPRDPVSRRNPGSDVNPLDGFSKIILRGISLLATLPFSFKRLTYRLHRVFSKDQES